MSHELFTDEVNMQKALLTVNGQQSIIKIESDKLYYSDNRKIRLIKGNNIDRIPLILDCFKKNEDPYSDCFKNRYALDESDINRIIQTLIRSKFLLSADAGHVSEQKTIGLVSSIGVYCGDITFRKMLVEQVKGNSKISFIDPCIEGLESSWQDELFIDRFKKDIDKSEVSSLLLFPAGFSNNTIASLNKALIDLNIPYLLIMFNGYEFVVGPSVIPMKTPCIDCLYEHRIKYLKNAGIDRNMFLRNVESYEIDYTKIHSSRMQWLSWLVKSELNRLTGSEKPLLLKQQIRIPLDKPYQLNTTTFEPITSCPSCCGMNRGHLHIGRPLSPCGNVEFINSTECTDTKYKSNGLRSADALTSKKLLDQALGKLGLAVKIEKITSREMDKIIPSYVSRVSPVYSSELPFIVGERFHWGKGMTEEQAYLSGGFELMERISAEYYGNVEMIRCPYKEVKDIALNIPIRTGDVFYSRNIDVLDENKEIDWVWGYSYKRGKAILVPASMAYLTSAVFNGKFIPNSSSGLSAGATVEDAILQGLMEAIEHDARYIIQANSITMPKFINASFPMDVADLIHKFESLNFEVIIRNYTLDNGVYMFKTWLVQKDNPLQHATCGMGANLDPLIALNRALSEAKQSWPVFPRPTETHYAAKVNSELYDYNSCSLFSQYQDIQVDILPKDASVDFARLSNKSTGSVVKDIERTISMVSEQTPTFDVVVVNLTKDIFNIPVVRVIASGLQNPSQPLQNFPRGRLFDVPVKLGLSDKKLTFGEIFNDRHPQ
jgi:thiazole/oxazole-forming peptide maturase SagD family component